MASFKLADHCLLGVTLLLWNFVAELKRKRENEWELCTTETGSPNQIVCNRMGGYRGDKVEIVLQRKVKFALCIYEYSVPILRAQCFSLVCAFDRVTCGICGSCSLQRCCGTVVTCTNCRGNCEDRLRGHCWAIFSRFGTRMVRILLIPQ